VLISNIEAADGGKLIIRRQREGDPRACRMPVLLGPAT
jgi:hypothetical protein